MTFGQKIKKLRLEKEWTQSYVGKQIGVSDRVLGYYESDNRFPKDEKILKALASLYNVTVDYLLGESQHENRNKALIPVLGTVQAGIPIEAIEDIIDYEELHPSMLEHGEEYFALQVKGSSMEPRMRDGDVVIVRKQADVNHDDTAIVLVNGNEATIKRVLKSEAGIMLAPNNPAYEPKFYSNKDIAELPVQIIGRVVELRAKF
jgi:repressor LexA